jgi:hypothetical protein
VGVRAESSIGGGVACGVGLSLWLLLCDRLRRVASTWSAGGRGGNGGGGETAAIKGRAPERIDE